jgi:hypothetical protein
MKKMLMVTMIVLCLSSFGYTATLFSDDFSASTFTGWTLTQSTGTVTNGKDGYYAELYSPSTKFSAARLKTQNVYTIGDGLVVDATLMFPMNDPGYGTNLTYRPHMAIQDASGVKHLGIYSPFSSGTTAAPIKTQTLNSGTMADSHTTTSVGTSAWWRFVITIYSDHALIRMYDFGNYNKLVEQWTETYDPMESIQVVFSADDPGWWPASRLFVNNIDIINPAGCAIFQNGWEGYFEQSNVMMQAGEWGAAGYSEVSTNRSMFFGQNSATYQARNLLKFDLEGSLPEGAQVTSAVLTLTVQTVPSPVPANPNVLGVYAAKKPWNTASTTWLNWGLGGDNEGYCNAEPDATVNISPSIRAKQRCTLVLSPAMVQAWIDRPWENYGVLLKQTDWQLDNFTIFGSNNVQYGPKLELVFSSPTGAKKLTSGHRTLLKKGLQILANYIDGDSFSMPRFLESNCTTMDIPDDYMHAEWIASNPDVLWARMTWHNILGGEWPYIKNLVSIKEGDEQDITGSENLTYIKNQLAYFKAKCPHVIMYTNQWGGQCTYNELHNYVLYVQPDMVMFDKYPFKPTQIGLPSTYYSYMATYRQLGLEGLDGTGSQPIPSALYTQTFVNSSWGNHRVTESEMRLNQFSAWVFGFKYVDMFVYMTPERDTTLQSLLFDGMGDTSPTTEFYQLAETNRQSRNLGPALVRLLSTNVRMIMGRNSSGVANPTPAGVTSGLTNADSYMTGITVTNIGSKNNGQPGDVIVGFFKPLHETFDGSNYTDQKYFMITNGLSDPSGTAAQTRQQIRVNFNFGTSGITSLQRVRRSDGKCETVNLLSDGGSLYHLDLTLDGGTGDLFKYNTGAPFVGVTQKALIPGDANADGMVDVGDLGILAANYGGNNKSWAQGDFNGDGLVDVGDLGILAANYGTNSNSSMNWDAAYAQAFGTTVAEDEDDSVAETGSPACSALGLPLIAGLFLAGLMLVKLEE